MRSTDSHVVARARQVIAALLFSISLSAGTFSADSIMLDAYLREDMTVWKAYVDTLNVNSFNVNSLLYEYGFCGYMVDRDKAHALPYVKQFKQHVQAHKSQLPKGHYEMYMSAVYVYELRLHESMRPVKAMSLAQSAVQLAPEDPLTLAYFATCLFFAPKPFGSKQAALQWFERADKLFEDPQWEYCWVRAMTKMYIEQCHQKLKK